MEDKMTERVNLVMTREDRLLLEALAEANTGANVSKMVRFLVQLATRKPGTLGIHRPKACAPRKQVAR